MHFILPQLFMSWGNHAPIKGYQTYQLNERKERNIYDDLAV